MLRRILLALLLSSQAQAASRVAIVRPEQQDKPLREAVTRLRAELTAAGFEVEEVDLAHAEDAREGVETSGDAFAAVMLRRAPRGAAIDVWVSDRISGKTLVRRIEAQPNEMAIRALELIRASLLEVTVERPPPPPDVPPPPPPPPVPLEVRVFATPPPSRPILSVEGAAAMLHSVDGIGPAFAPQLRAWIPLADRLVGRLSITGPAMGSDVRGAVGTAFVRQEMARAEIAYALVSGPRGAVYGSLGAGVYHLYTSGTASLPYKGEKDDVWAATLDLGASGALRLGGSFALVLDVHALATLPRAVVAMDGAPVASAGRPSLLTSLGVAAPF